MLSNSSFLLFSGLKKNFSFWWRLMMGNGVVVFFCTIYNYGKSRWQEYLCLLWNLIENIYFSCSTCITHRNHQSHKKGWSHKGNQLHIIPKGHHVAVLLKLSNQQFITINIFIYSQPRIYTKIKFTHRILENDYCELIRLAGAQWRYDTN